MKTLMVLIALNFVLVGCGAKDAFERGHAGANTGFSTKPDPGTGGGGGGGGGGTKPVALSKALFEQTVLPVLENSCAKCHDNPAPTFEEASKLVVLGHPEKSPLLQRAFGQLGHKKRWEATSAEAVVVKTWIMGGEIDMVPAEEKQSGENFFNSAVKPIIASTCTRCHEGRDEYAEAKSLIKPKAPNESQLYLRPSGVKHRKIWAADSKELATIKAWIELEN